MKMPLWVLGLCCFLRCALGAESAPRQEHDMVYVPAGEFVMGTSEEEARRLAQQYDVHPTLFLGESPRRTVSVKAFWIDRCPVTHAQYKRFVDATGHRPPFEWRGKSIAQGKADHPVTGLLWQDADAYARWAGLRLPTAVEWEKAARGSDGRLYPWGNTWLDHATRLGDPRDPQTRPLTTPVGAFPDGASPYGVLDLCGNVAEWTSTPSEPPNPKLGWAWYVIKGAGATMTAQYNFRCAARNFSAHASRWHPWLGFRCARDAAEPPPSQPAARPVPPVPPVQPAEGPREDLFGKEPIRIEVAQGHAGAVLRVPYFPVGQFGLSMPEQAGPAGIPMAWGAKHEPFRWEKTPEGAWQYLCRFPGTAEMRVTLVPRTDCVDFTIAIRNLTGKPFSDVWSNTCFNVHGSPYFEDPERVRSFVWTDAGPTCMLQMPIGYTSGEPLHNGWTVATAAQAAPKGGNLVRHPFIFIRSRDGRWVIAQAYAQATSVASNAHYSCLHTRPLWPDIPAGQERAMSGKIYFLRGGPDELFARWKADFGK